MIYPERNTVKEGIEYFCEEYFREYVRINLKRKQDEDEKEE